ncbi:MAG: LCP family protein [Collinsella sp.]
MIKAVNDLCFDGEQKVSHYAEVNFPGMEQLIDAVGGIDLEATEEVDDPAHLDVKVEKGWQHMDGRTALAYARCRYHLRRRRLYPHAPSAPGARRPCLQDLERPGPRQHHGHDRVPFQRGDHHLEPAGHPGGRQRDARYGRGQRHVRRQHPVLRRWHDVCERRELRVRVRG